MKLIRYRKPSVKTLVGYTKVKRQVKHSIGLSQFEGWTKPSRIKQRVKAKVGFYSPTMRVIRNSTKGRFPSFLRLFIKK